MSVRYSTAGHSEYPFCMTTTAAPAEPPSSVSSDLLDRTLVLAQLERICASAEFVRSERMIRFLRLVTESTLDGRREELKERFIGERVFDRKPDWDPKLDSVVRTEARRLREKLDSYYQRLGKPDRVKVHIPKGQYAPVFELATLPDTVLETQKHQLLPPGKESEKRSLFPLLAAISSIAALCIFFILQQRPPRNSTFHVVPFADELGPELNPAISPDGKTLAYAWDGGKGNLDIYFKPREGGSPLRFTDNPAPEVNPAWSPDGTRLAFLRIQGQLATVVVKEVHGSGERVLAEVDAQAGGSWASDNGRQVGNMGPAWSRDGHELFVADRTRNGNSFAIFSVALDSGLRRQLTAPPNSARDFYPRVSPDGSRLAFLRYSSHGVGDLFVQFLKSGSALQVTHDRHAIRGESWESNNHRLVFSSNREGGFQFWSIDASGQDLRPLGMEASSVSDPDVAPDGKAVAFVEPVQNWNIWRVPVDAGKLGAPQLFLSSTGRNHSPRYSPDGSRIVFVSDRSGSWEIWTADANGTELKQLTHFTGPWLGGLSWSPDGKWIAFDIRKNSHSSLYRISSSGGSPQAIAASNAEERMPVYSRDGSSIYFNSDRDGSVGIWKYSFADGAVKRVSAQSGFLVRESLNDQSLYLGDEQGSLWQVASGAEPRKVIAGITPCMAWDLSSDRLYFSRSAIDGHDQIAIMEKGQAHSLLELGKPLVTGMPSLNISPDGHWILLTQLDREESDIQLLVSDAPVK